MNKKQRRQQGFTLIEIIAVIILLGVLAATVIPKFSDLTEEAKKAAAKQAVAEGIARANQVFASHILTAGAVPTAYAEISAGLTSGNIGDYVISYAAATGGVQVNGWSTDGASSDAVSGLARFPTT